MGNINLRPFIILGVITTYELIFYKAIQIYQLEIFSGSIMKEYKIKTLICEYRPFLNYVMSTFLSRKIKAIYICAFKLYMGSRVSFSLKIF